MRMKVFRMYIVLAALTGVIASAEAAIYYVATDGDGTNPSNSWATAATNIQTAINLATNSGDQVCVKQGTYNITNQIQMTSTNSGVELLGGYVGSGTPGPRTNDPSLTVINAGGKCRVIYCTGVTTGKIDGFTITGGYVSGSAVNGGGILLADSGLTISHNLITGNSCGWWGGGVCCNNSISTISHNRITGNYCGNYGGGIYSTGGSPLINNNLITANSAAQGGGIYYNGNSTTRNNSIVGNSASTGGGIYRYSGSVTIKDCIIWGNGDDLYNCTATYSCIEDGDAGEGNISAAPLFVFGWYLSQTNAGQSSQSPCVDAGSQSAAAAGLDGRNTRSDGVNDAGTVDMGYHYSGASPAVTRYVSNSGTNAGAGTIAAPWKNIGYALTNVAEGSTINVLAGTYNTASGETFPLQVTKDAITLQGSGRDTCIIDAAAASPRTRVIIFKYAVLGALDGFTITGGLLTGSENNGAGVRLDNSSPTISNNLITKNSCNWHGSGIYCLNSSAVIIHNRIIGNSITYYGGGIYFTASNPFIKNNLIVSNSAQKGAGIFCSGNYSEIRNNTIVSNTAAGAEGGGIQLESGSATIKDCIIWGNGDDLWSVTATYSCIEDGDAGEGNIALDPKFVNPAGGDYHLKSGAGTWNGSGWTRYPGQNSPGIDAGDPASDYSNEPAPNGRRINMGAYGNTSEASKTLSKGTIFVIY